MLLIKFNSHCKMRVNRIPTLRCKDKQHNTSVMIYITSWKNINNIQWWTSYFYFTFVYFGKLVLLFPYIPKHTLSEKKGTKAVTGAVPFQKLHFCIQRLHIGTLVVHIST